MTSIDKLSIRGIRSFSPNDAQVIEFYKPLTLIVGKNGSGKTTTIETLNMITCGNLPPNCRGGQAFINDPNALGTSEVKAQIKLRFTSVNKKAAVCTRSFSLTQKPQKREYKAFECSLRTMGDDGQQQTYSYKAAELNKLVPEMMGVSQAVLESVVFVHQEDSCWPLAEDKVVKQKFDDIFAATEYTKALDAIKHYKTEKGRDIKTAALELETLSTKLDNATRLRTDLADAEKTLKDIQEGIDAAVKTISEAKARMPQLREQFERRDALRAELKQTSQYHMNAMDNMQQALEMLLKNFEHELEEDDDELQQIEAQQSSQVITLTAEMDAHAAKITEVEGEIARAETTRDQWRARLEEHRAQEAHHKRIETDAAKAIDALGSEYCIQAAIAAGAPTALPAARSRVAVEALSRVLESRKAELCRSKEERQQVSNTLGASVQKLRVELDHTSVAAAAKEKEAAEANSRVRALQQRADETTTFVADETTLSRLQQEVRDLKCQAAIAEEELGSSDLTSQIAQLKTRRRGLKDKQVALNEELCNIEREGDKMKRLRQLEAGVSEKREKLDAAIADRRPKLALVMDLPDDMRLREMLERDAIQRELLRKRQQREADVDAKEREMKTAEAKMQRKAMDVHAKQEAVRTLEAEVARTEAQIHAQDSLMVSEAYDWAGQQAELDDKVGTMMEQKSGGSGMLQFLEKAVDKAGQHDPRCMLCTQALDERAKGEIKKRRDHCVNLTNGADLDSQLADAQERAAKHKRSREQWAQCKRQKTVEVPATQQTLGQLREEHAALKREHEQLASELEELRASADKARDLMRDVDHLKYIHKELQGAQGEVAHTQSGMQSGMHTAMRGKETVTEERESTGVELERLERELDERGQQLDSKRAELSETRDRSAAKELEYSKAQAAADRQHELAAQIGEISARSASLQAEARKLREGEKPSREKLAAMENEFRGEEQRLDSAVREHDARVARCTADHTKLVDYSVRLAEGEKASFKQMMADCQLRFDEADKQVLAKRTQLKGTLRTKDELADKIKGQDKFTMMIRENLRYRELRAKERELHAQKRELETQLHRLDPASEAAVKDYHKLQERITAKESERARFSGSRETVANQIKTYSEQLKETQYRRIDAEHREKLIEHKTVQMAVDDLNKYYKALNAALMRFHETKMADINKSITELWNKTYKGSDIDGIAIKTEDEGQTADGRRRQTYRVVMRKGDTTLDMRGRCSAGQKVLASLVIRLALAESFCVNCGILALDEPTTNLDRANIESLAQAINEIIKQRRQQSNFQLIVITHDEEFVQLIGRGENCSHYYWIEKRFLKEGDPPASTIIKRTIDRFG